MLPASHIEVEVALRSSWAAVTTEVRAQNPSTGNAEKKVIEGIKGEGLVYGPPAERPPVPACPDPNPDDAVELVVDC